jgi:hypothetical protein
LRWVGLLIPRARFIEQRPARPADDQVREKFAPIRNPAAPRRSYLVFPAARRSCESGVERCTSQLRDRHRRRREGGRVQREWEAARELARGSNGASLALARGRSRDQVCRRMERIFTQSEWLHYRGDEPYRKACPRLEDVRRSPTGCAQVVHADGVRRAQIDIGNSSSFPNQVTE